MANKRLYMEETAFWLRNTEADHLICFDQGKATNLGDLRLHVAHHNQALPYRMSNLVASRLVAFGIRIQLSIHRSFSILTSCVAFKTMKRNHRVVHISKANK